MKEKKDRRAEGEKVKKNSPSRVWSTERANGVFLLSFFFMFNATRLKVQLKLSINRLKMLQAKKTSLNQQQRREIGTLLEKGKVESARVRVEHVIRDDLVIEAMESLELYSDLLLARFGLLEAYK